MKRLIICINAYQMKEGSRLEVNYASWLYKEFKVVIPIVNEEKDF